MREYETIYIQNYFESIKRHIWMIILIVAIAVTVSGLLSYYVLTPIYETSTTLMVGQAKDPESTGVEYYDVLLSQKLVKTYSEIAMSNTVLKEVINNLDLDLTPGAFKSNIEVSNVGETEIISITVQDPSPVMAAKIANNLSSVFIDHVQRIMKVDNVQVIDAAEIPANPIKPQPLLNMGVAGFLGLIVSLGIILILEYLDHTIKTSDDVEKYLELPVLGIIPVINEKGKQ